MRSVCVLFATGARVFVNVLHVVANEILETRVEFGANQSNNTHGVYPMDPWFLLHYTVNHACPSFVGEAIDKWETNQYAEEA